LRRETLLILVEGVDDETFFTRIVKRILQQRFAQVEIRQWSQMKKEKIDALIRSFKSPNFPGDYLFVSDINNEPCVTAKKRKLQEDEFPSLELEKTIIVVPEIEAWYLAGLDAVSSKELGLNVPPDTNATTKEQFNKLANKLIPEHGWRTVVLMEILDRFNLETAKSKNRSFSYFVNFLQRLIH